MDHDKNFCIPDLKKASQEELTALCQTLRKRIIGTVAENGGHLGSNLGMVEATVMLHRLFDMPKDSVLFDVGHQCYAHKLLSDRWDCFDTLRRFGGISGFPRREESEYDSFSTGHSGSALSAAVGLARAKKLKGDDSYTLCVIGDGSFTNGMVYEAINHAAEARLKLIILLNDNEMSISRNVGAFSRRLSRIRSSERYFTFKHHIKRFFGAIPLIGQPLIRGAVGLRDLLKRLLVKSTLLENMGLDYIGPVDGNDLSKLETVLKEAKTKDTVCLVHMVTKKGKGYLPAEEEPEKWHSAPAFGVAPKVGLKKPSFSDIFGGYLCEMAEKNGYICAVTAAMKDGTGLDEFARRYPLRFFDVGIAEEHQAAFCGGLAIGGMHPFCVVYATFAQRAYDQLLMDVSLQKVPVTLALDRAGVVPGDGVTHQGVYDVALFSTVPGVMIYSPDTYDELRVCMDRSTTLSGLTVIRYPKGSEASYDRSIFREHDGFSVAEIGPGEPRMTVITYGRLTAAAVQAAKALAEEGYSVRIIKLLQIHPMPKTLLQEISPRSVLYLLEEGVRCGGVAEAIAAAVADRKMEKIEIHAIDSGFIPHGDLAALDGLLGFTPEQLGQRFLSVIKRAEAADSAG